MMLCDELKDYNIMDIEAMDDERLEKSESGKIQVTRVYIKSEADKVIVRNKYKRCLAMALVWLERSENSTDLENELVSRKRCCKWMEIAEKFKESK